MSGPSVARDGVRGRPSPAAPEATGNGSDNGLALPRTAGLVTVPQKIGCGNSAVYAAHVRVQDPAWSPANMKRIEHSFLLVTADHLWRCDLAASEPNILAPSMPRSRRSLSEGPERIDEIQKPASSHRASEPSPSGEIPSVSKHAGDSSGAGGSTESLSSVKGKLILPRV
ncbi:hypothetical protein AURDEDRAFT_159825 [Auricularia subglabra TFB-10046 SS5]|nr:hypothetical protein AURDEDRAFT_159825 [Auricularia subglabra TFB-10046 SS5]